MGSAEIFDDRDENGGESARERMVSIVTTLLLAINVLKLQNENYISRRQ